MGATYSQFFSPYPTLTEANFPSQQGKVFIVVGGTSGVGFELCAILYQAGGKVYLAGRSEPAAQSAISKIKTLSSTSPGELVFLSVHLDDLATIKPAVEVFTAVESKLNVLFNNAGVSCPPLGSISAQGHELQMATNCLGHYLLTQLLLPTPLHTAESAFPAAVRVTWTSSVVVDLSAPECGTDIADLTDPPPDRYKNYITSKTGNWFLASALAAQVCSKGILCVTQTPGNLKTACLRHSPWILGFVTVSLFYRATMGAYTELWAGLSEELGIGDGGKYVLPWGRLHPSPRPVLLAAMKTREDGGIGVAASFFVHCEKQTAEFRSLCLRLSRRPMFGIKASLCIPSTAPGSRLVVLRFEVGESQTFQFAADHLKQDVQPGRRRAHMLGDPQRPSESKRASFRK